MAALLCVFTASPVAVWALEEQFETLSASVEIAPVFSLSLPNAVLPFNDLKLGEPAILGEGGYFNEAKCRSNSGRGWSVKVQLVSLKHMQRGISLPASALKIRVAERIGDGDVQLGRANFESLSEEPVLLYVSRGADNEGQEVVLRFQYSLEPPGSAPAGSYVGQIVLTMAENL